MKEIIAIIRPKQWQKTKNKLMEEGFTGFTVQRCHGRGKQKGLQYLSKSGAAKEGIQFLPKRMVTILASDDEVQKITEILIEVNYTGELGDGKIFICPVENLENIRTGEKCAEALVYARRCDLEERG